MAKKNVKKQLEFEDWRQEFYPIDALTFKGNVKDAVTLSLKKWEGLKPAILKKYGLRYFKHDLFQGNELEMVMDSDSCHLCIVFFTKNGSCSGCPLNVLDCGCLDEVYETRRDSPWNNAKYSPDHMIQVLKETKKFVDSGAYDAYMKSYKKLH